MKNKTIRKYGLEPFQAVLLHGGPGAIGELNCVAKELSKNFGVLELLQTQKSVIGQINEVFNQLISISREPKIIVGYSWGAWLGFLFSSRYPKFVKKLILISAGSFIKKYNQDFMITRLGRLDDNQRFEANLILEQFANNDYSDLQRFGELMTIADSFAYEKGADNCQINIEIFNLVWSEASALRDNGSLFKEADNIKCPVTAIHGDYDTHPVDGVEKPLKEKIDNFKMIVLKNCGHKMWKEKFARDEFYKILTNEIKTE